eukprot:CAMPEP_0113930058 /NCGR_PEP_ID=MMETSP1159-20121227/5714_1 /TAXON_ID=88271 /ORGANISM="Picocystis salinarum" /LENGTH=229 /DNA_ID=CAMNT_0000930749 /DNA_START=42 /DNA_END=728 /DNA_ORIENTATION=- /assembly_acc=CAM_ASM_000767
MRLGVDWCMPAGSQARSCSFEAKKGRAKGLASVSRSPLVRESRVDGFGNALRVRLRSMDASSSSSSTPARRVRGQRQSKALAARTNVWLLKHGRPTVPRNLSAKERREVDDCFELLDADDSGTLDPDELLRAFQMLGVSASKAHVVRLMEQIDADGNGELDQQEFRALMAQQLGQSASEVVASDATGAKEDVQDRALPLQTMLLAFRRRKTLQDFLRGGEARARIRLAM